MSARSFTAQIDGILWSFNRHGVAARKEPDPYLPGFEVLVFADYDTEVALRSLAQAAGFVFETICKCRPRN